MSDLVSIFDRLVDNQVEFVLVGGFAAVAHGASLLTGDVDICMDFSPANLERFLRAMKGLEPVHRITPKQIPLASTLAEIKGLRNMYLTTSLGQLNCLSHVVSLGEFPAVRM